MWWPDGAVRAPEKVFRGLFELVFPDDCRVCAQPLHEISRIPVCRRCLNDCSPLIAEFYCVSCRTPFLNRFPLDDDGRCALCRLGLNGFDAVYSYGSYEGSLRRLIHLFKYGGVQPLAGVFGKFLALALPREESFDLIIPMPLHWTRRWQRRYNQAALLAREISKRWNVPVKSVARRRRATAPQAGLTHAKRRDNVAGAFSVKQKLDGLHVLLVDDVLTTGASASACARALKRAGADRVTVLALARTDRRSMLSYDPEMEAAALRAAAGSSLT
jgi:ComF family protein